MEEPFAKQLDLHELLLHHRGKPEERRQREAAREGSEPTGGTANATRDGRLLERADGDEEGERRDEQQGRRVVGEEDERDARGAECDAPGGRLVHRAQDSEKRDRCEREGCGFGECRANEEIEREVGDEQPGDGAGDRRFARRAERPSNPVRRDRSCKMEEEQPELEAVREPQSELMKRKRRDVNHGRGESEQRLTVARTEIGRPDRRNVTVADGRRELDQPRRVLGCVVTLDEPSAQQRPEAEDRESQQAESDRNARRRQPCPDTR